jgi:hypothetical protein
VIRSRMLMTMIETFEGRAPRPQGLTY